MSYISLFSPPRCPLCSRYAEHEDELLCGGCAALLAPIRRALKGTRDVTAFAVFAHDDRARSAIHAIKFGADSARARAMGRLCGRLLNRHYARSVAPTLVPIPTTAKSFRRRGFNQAALIAEGCAAETGWEVQRNLLRKREGLTEQKHRNAIERRALSDAFEVREAPRTKDLILVDDVMTTGATFASAASALLDAGSDHVSAVALSYTPHRERAAQQGHALPAHRPLIVHPVLG